MTASGSSTPDTAISACDSLATASPSPRAILKNANLSGIADLLAEPVVNRPFPSSDTRFTMTMQATDNAYLRNAVMTATPEQLQLMLYDGAIRNATLAREAIVNKDFETSFDRLTRAQNILNEMQSGLNYEVNRELCQRVASIYNFIFRKLVDANVHRDTQAIDDALKVLRVERETWQLLVDKVNRIRDEQSDSERSATAATAASFSMEG